MESVDEGTITIEELENKLSQIKSDIRNVENNLKDVTGVEYGKLINTFRKRRMPPISRDERENDIYKNRRTNFNNKKQVIQPIVVESRPKIPSKITAAKHPIVESLDDTEHHDEEVNKSLVKGSHEYNNISIDHSKPQLSESDVKRGARMFGLMMKTLTDFKKEAEKSYDEMKKRDEILNKVTQQEKEADIKAKEERAELLRLRNKKQREMINIRKAIRYKELEQLSIKEYELHSKFIKTKSSPPIFFIPHSMTESTKLALTESNNELKKILDEKIAHFRLAVSVIENETNMNKLQDNTNHTEKNADFDDVDMVDDALDSVPNSDIE